MQEGGVMKVLEMMLQTVCIPISLFSPEPFVLEGVSRDGDENVDEPKLMGSVCTYSMHTGVGVEMSV